MALNMPRKSLSSSFPGLVSLEWIWHDALIKPNNRAHVIQEEF